MTQSLTSLNPSAAHLHALSGRRVAVIGAGPAGLFAAEQLAHLGHSVTIYDRMRSPGRKFLMAGRGGLNLTHSEELETFLTRYDDPDGTIRRAVRAFAPGDLMTWARGLGIETFTGTSGRVFPKAMKASHLLRAWLRRLSERDVVLQTSWNWRGFDPSSMTLSFETSQGVMTIQTDGVVLALGGASWPRLGSDGAWHDTLVHAGIDVAPLRPSNCGISIGWSPHMMARMTDLAGQPLKRIALTCDGERRRGEAVITRAGLEGGAVYALSQALRRALDQGHARITIDFKPDMDVEDLAKRLAKAGPKDSLANVLRKHAHLSPAAAAVLREAGTLPRDARLLAEHIKSCSLPLTGLAGMDRAISTAGGIRAASCDDTLMLRTWPGVFVAGEMLDFDAPTGGYLLQAAFATGRLAAKGLESWLQRAPFAAHHKDPSIDADGRPASPDSNE